MKLDRQAVILAGGLGSRLRPFTEVIPKPLLPIGERSVLEIQIYWLKKYGFKKVYLATNYKADYLENFMGDGSRFGIDLKISKEEKPLGTAGPLSLLKDEILDPFIVMNGDILTKANFAKFYDFSKKLDSMLTVAIKKIIVPFAFGKISYNEDYVTDIKEKPDLELEILAGIYFMTPEIFELIPEDEYFGMDNLIRIMLERNFLVGKYRLDEYWLDIGQIKDYETAQELYDSHFSDKQEAVDGI